MKLLCWQKQKVRKPIWREAKERAKPEVIVNQSTPTTVRCHTCEKINAVFPFPFDIDLSGFIYFCTAYPLFISKAKGTKTTKGNRIKQARAGNLDKI